MMMVTTTMETGVQLIAEYNLVTVAMEARQIAQITVLSFCLPK